MALSNIGAELDVIDELDDTALTWAIYNKHTEIATYLLARGAAIGKRNIYGDNALSLAIKRHQDMVEPLLLQMVTLEIGQQQEMLQGLSSGIYPSVLYYAAIQKPALLPQLLKVIKPNGILNVALLDVRYGIGETVLMTAVARGDLDAVNAFIEADADVNAQDGYGDTALTQAVYRGHTEIAKLLLAKSITILSVRNKGGKNALDIAIQKQHPGMVELLLLKIASLPLAQQTGMISFGDYPDVFSYVVAEKPLFLSRFLAAMKSGDGILSTTLLGARASDKDAALIVAATAGDLDAVNTLIAAGANIAVKSQDGETVLDISKKHGRHSLEKILTLYTQVESLQTYGRRLSGTENPVSQEEGKRLIDLAGNLKKKIDEFINVVGDGSTDVRKMRVTEGRQRETRLREIRQEFRQLLQDESTTMTSEHKAMWGPILLNIAIAATGIGLLLVIAQLLLTGHGLFMLSERQQHVDGVRCSFNRFEEDEGYRKTNCITGIA